jgi:hypothetical protein
VHKKDIFLLERRLHPKLMSDRGKKDPVPVGAYVDGVGNRGQGRNYLVRDQR